MRTSRRTFLGASAGLATLAASPVRLLAATAPDGVIELTARHSRQKLFADGKPSELWTYNGQSPGPEIRVRKGERVRVRFVNKLSEPTSVHWHGVRIDNAMDGVAGLTQPPIEPGESFDYDFITPDAGTYWYHAHNRSWNQVARGLYGSLIVEEAEPAFDRDHDLNLVVDDWRVDREGVLDVASFGSMMDWSHAGRLGNLLTTNGVFRPAFALKSGEAYRVRLTNASNARVLEIDPSRFGAKIMAYDGQALPEPITLPYSPLLLGPAQRVDLLLAPEAAGPLEIEEISSDNAVPIARLNVTGNAGSAGAAPRLVPNALAEPDLASANKFRLEMTGGAMGRFVETTYNGKVLGEEDYRTTKQVWAFNGVANIADQPFFSVRRGESVVLDVANLTAFAHAMHVHGHHFRIISRGGSEVDEGRPWRDTFLVGADQTTRIAFVTDNPGKWLLHCHMLEHAAAGMTTWFEVT